jgi:hypothetical protein
MAEAWIVLSDLWSTLELRDETGFVLPIPVERFSERVVSTGLGDIPATVVAALRERYAATHAAEPPAT